jgi:type I restriction enzyme S subunit
MINKDFQNEVLKYGKASQATLPIINKSKWENLIFSYPKSKNEQKRIVKELDTLSEKVRQLQEIYTKQIANCDELKQSLLQKAFEGEL